MVNRKTEGLSFEAFSIGSEYSRPEIAKPGNVELLTNTREWTGIVKFQNCIVLFSTLIKENLPPEHGLGIPKSKYTKLTCNSAHYFARAFIE